MSESDLVRLCLDWLHAKGIESWRQNQGAIPLGNGKFRRFNGRKGIADISGILKQTVEIEGEIVDFGVRLEIECKMPGKKLRPEQEEFLHMIEEQGGIALCVHDLQELEEGLAPYLPLN